MVRQEDLKVRKRPTDGSRAASRAVGRDICRQSAVKFIDNSLPHRLTEVLSIK
jgi:hypothetical protein